MKDTHTFKLTLPNGDSCTLVTGYETSIESFVREIMVMAYFRSFSKSQAKEIYLELLRQLEEEKSVDSEGS